MNIPEQVKDTTIETKLLSSGGPSCKTRSMSARERKIERERDFKTGLGDKNSHAITKTCLYNFDPLKPHFYIVKLGFTGVYIIFLISAQKRSTHNLCFEQKYENYQFFSSENFHFLVVKISVYLNRHVFVMAEKYK